MQEDFHYYGTYCAAYLAGCSHEESLKTAWCAQFTDLCTRTFLQKIKAPLSAATTQTQAELLEARTDIVGLQDITRIWASFHFLPRDLHGTKLNCGKRYLDKFRLICGPDGELALGTVKIAQQGGPEAWGLALHVIADTWAHMYFAGTPSLVINNTTYHFYEMTGESGEENWRLVRFRHKAGVPDDLENGIYTNTVFQGSENSIMNLGHGRAGHFPDYSFMRYRYLPAWGRYYEMVKDNPSDYLNAFGQMIHAIRFLKGAVPEFKTGCYDREVYAPYLDRIRGILTVRRPDASEDWRAFGRELSGQDIPPHSTSEYEQEYVNALPEEKDGTRLGQFFLAALRQKSMVTSRIYQSGNLLAGISLEYDGKHFRGDRDFMPLIGSMIGSRGKER